MCVCFVNACVFIPCVNICLTCMSIFTPSILSLYPWVCLAFILQQFLEPSIDIASDSNLGSFIYETVYDAASTIDYSKDPIDAGVVDSPPPKKIYRHSPSPSPLKGLGRTCVPTPPSRPVGAGAPQRRLRMDARPTNSGPPHVPLRGASPVQANSDASVPRTKVHYITTICLIMKR